MSHRESRSNQFPVRRCPRFSLRRSPRLHGKPAASHPIQDSTQKPAAAHPIQTSTRRKPSKRLPRKPGPSTYVTRGSNIDEHLRRGRKFEAREFRNDYRYDDSKEKRVYINSNGETTTWMDRSAGCTWVAVHEKYVICVALKGTLDMDRFRSITQKNWAHRLFGINVLSEIEDIANSTEDSRQTMDNPVKTPFAVVSWIPSTSNGQEGGDEASGAVEYLKEKMKSRLGFSGTIQTAISGLVRLFSNKKLKANEIWVYVGAYNMQRYLLPDDIMWHLSVIKTNEIEVQQILDIEHSALSDLN